MILHFAVRVLLFNHDSVPIPSHLIWQIVLWKLSADADETGSVRLTEFIHVLRPTRVKAVRACMCGIFVPSIWKVKTEVVHPCSHQQATSLCTTITCHMARDFSYLGSSQPNSSQSSCDNARDEEGAVERAFWQSTPTALEQLRRGADDECHQTRARALLFLSRGSVIVIRSHAFI